MVENENRYYVYAYLDPRKKGAYKYGEYLFEYEPFYIGKGCRCRLTQHIFDAKKNRREKNPRIQKINKIISLGLYPIIIKVVDKLSNDTAYEIENTLIGLIGRIDIKTGVLTNCNEGGMDSEIQGKELRERINNGRKKIPNFKGENNPMFGVHRVGEKSPHFGHHHTEETKQFLSKLHKGCSPNKTSFKKGVIPWNKNTKGLQKSWIKGKILPCKEYVFFKDGEQIIIDDLQRFCKINKLAYSVMVRLHTKGFSHDKKKPHYTAKNYYKGYSNINYPIKHIF